MILFLYTPNITYMQQADNENLFKLAKKINELRISKSKSLNKFVLSKGFTTTATWSRIENGLVDLKFSTLLRVSRMLEVPVDKLLCGIDFNYNFPED